MLFMKEKNRVLFARVVGFVMTLALSVFVLAAVIWGLGTNASLMHAQFERFAPPARTGLEGQHYSGVAAMITGYLAGETPEFQYWVDGVPLFQAHEQLHMADCLGLFRLDRTVLIGCATAMLLLAGLAALAHGWRAWLGGFFAGSMTVLGAVIAVGLIGAVDFDRVFILFHQLSFANDLWLLNPATDLLIRLMPTAFFISYAGIGLGIWLGALVLMTGVSGWLLWGRKQTR